MIMTSSFTLKANTISTKNHGTRNYIVQKGDSLWGIATHLLHNPALWPTLWKNLSQKKVRGNNKNNNPNLIYPGDVLTLTWKGKQPTLMHKANLTHSPTFHLQKKVKPIVTIPLENIASFSSKNIVIDPTLIVHIPRILDSPNQPPNLIEGHVFYAEGVYETNRLYGLYRQGTLYKDLQTGKALGTELIFIGYSKVSVNSNEEGIYNKGVGTSRANKLTQHDLIKSVQEAHQGDLIMPVPEDESLANTFIPQLAAKGKKGNILTALNGASVFGKWDLVVIDKGAQDNIKAGLLFSIIKEKDAQTLNDTVKAKQLIKVNQKSRETSIGEIMVIKSYQQTSVAIILRAKETIWANYAIEGTLENN